MNILEVKVQEILLQDWDPIGIKDIPEARDEYNMYVSGVCAQIKKGKSIVDLYNYLREIEVERMGLDGEEQNTQRVAIKLSNLC